MIRIFLLAALTLVISPIAPSQTRNKQAALSQAERELITLSREAIDACIAQEIVVLEDSGPRPPAGMMGKATVRGKYDAVELADPQFRIDGDLAVVAGRVVFKGGLPEWPTKESSSAVTIRFARRDGRWEFVGLCMGKCAVE